MGEIKTYTEPGRGRKQCSACKIYVHVRSNLCVCGEAFHAKIAAPTKVVNVSPGSKPRQTGSKECPDCHNQIHHRLKVCSFCYHDFSLDAEEIPVDTRPQPMLQSEAQKWQRHIGWRGLVILTPGGDCPQRLYDEDQQSIEDWANLVIMRGLSEGKLYSPNALRCFIKEFCDPNSSRFTIISHGIEIWFQKMMDL